MINGFLPTLLSTACVMSHVRVRLTVHKREKSKRSERDAREGINGNKQQRTTANPNERDTGAGRVELDRDV